MPTVEGADRCLDGIRESLARPRSAHAERLLVDIHGLFAPRSRERAHQRVPLSPSPKPVRAAGVPFLVVARNGDNHATME